MTKTITNHVTWVGQVDWELTHFHGHELSTRRGSSYNSYLVRDRQTALIDTVWQPYDRQFLQRLTSVIDLQSIDYVVMQHNEVDHSGALVELMRHIPHVPIYCTAKGEAILRGHYHQDWNFVNVHTGDRLFLGDNCSLTFVEAPMLHWPDTMFSYLDSDRILFSNDAFGQHYATESLYDDAECLASVMQEAEKYYANILAPFSPLVARKLDELTRLGWPIDIICPSHGVIWRHQPKTIVEQYGQWANAYQCDQVTIVYDTMWQSTRLMAAAIAEGISRALPSTTIKLMNAALDDKNDILTEVFHSRAVLVGSPTINNGVSYAIAGLLEMMHGLKLKGKTAAAFGSYGWSGEAVGLLNKQLQAAGFNVVDEGLRALWVPTTDMLEQCRQWGETIAHQL